MYALVDFKSITTGYSKHINFDAEYLKEVANTLTEVGVVAPPIVTQIGVDCYELVAGIEIYEAIRYLRDIEHKKREWELVPCRIIKEEHRKAAMLQISAVYDTI